MLFQVWLKTSQESVYLNAAYSQWERNASAWVGGARRARISSRDALARVPYTIVQLINSSSSIQSNRQLLSLNMLRLNQSGFQTSVVFGVVTIEKVPTLLLLLITSLRLGKRTYWLTSYTAAVHAPSWGRCSSFAAALFYSSLKLIRSEIFMAHKKFTHWVHSLSMPVCDIACTVSECIAWVRPSLSFQT